MPSLEDFKVGDKWRSRNGSEWTIVHVNYEGAFTLTARLGSLSQTFTRTGLASCGRGTNPSIPGDDLLVRVIPERSGYWNVYDAPSDMAPRFHTSGPWPSAVYADNRNDEGRCDRIARVKFTFREGQFDD